MKLTKREKMLVGIIIIIVIAGIIFLGVPAIEQHYASKYVEQGRQECMITILQQVQSQGYAQINSPQGSVVLVPYQGG